MSVTVTNAADIRISVSVFGFEKIGELYENLGVPENDPTQNLTPLLKQNLSPLKVGTNSVIKNAEILVLDTFLLD